MVTPTPNSLHRVPNLVHSVVNSVNSKRAVIVYGLTYNILPTSRCNPAICMLNSGRYRLQRIMPNIGEELDICRLER